MNGSIQLQRRVTSSTNTKREDMTEQHPRYSQTLQDDRHRAFAADLFRQLAIGRTADLSEAISDPLFRHATDIETVFFHGFMDSKNLFVAYPDIWSNTKGAIFQLVERCEPHVAVAVGNATLRCLLDLYAFRDVGAAQELVELSHEHKRRLDALEVIRELVSVSLQSWNDLDLAKLGGKFLDEFFQRWEENIQVLRSAGLPPNADIGAQVAEFIPYHNMEELEIFQEPYYVRALKFFMDKGFSMRGGFPADDNPVFRTVVQALELSK